MFVMFNFNVDFEGKLHESPVMGTGDIERLKKLFPGNPVWKCRTSDLGNQMFPTVEEMKFLYIDVARYFTRKGLSPKPFQTGGFTGRPVISDLRSLFSGLIVFCEQKLGFKRPKKLKRRMAKMEAQYKRQAAAKEAKERKDLLALVKTLPKLRRPGKIELRKRLELKLFEYKNRFPLPKYKIELLKALLLLKHGEQLDLRSIVENAMAKSKGLAVAEEYYFASCGIAHYVNRRVKGVRVTGKLPQLATS